MTDLVERLRACENDPMWADHAEIPKLWCKQAADEIERLRAILTEPNWLVAISRVADYRRSQNIEPLPDPHTVIDREFLGRRLDTVDFGNQTNRIIQLHRRDDNFDWVPVATVRELVTMTEAEVLRVPNVGRKCMERIKAVLAEHGLHLGMEV